MREGAATWLNAIAAGVSAIAAVSIAVTTGRLADFFSRETIQILPLDQIVLFEDSSNLANQPVVSIEPGIFNSGAGSNAISEQHVQIDAGATRLACFEGRAYADIRLHRPSDAAAMSTADCGDAAECIALPNAVVAVKTDPWVVGVPPSSVFSERAIFSRDDCPNGEQGLAVTFETLIQRMTDQPVNVRYIIRTRSGEHETICAVQLPEAVARTALRDKFLVLSCAEDAASR